MELKFSNRLISKKDFENLFKQDDRDLVVYLHNPFCATKDNCRYCMHKGCPTRRHNEEEVEKFYFSYMPKLFKLYENIINEKNIALVDFGGGTPNYLPYDKFDKYCSLLPQKLKEARKVIELHPAFLNKDYIDVLKKYNFTTIIVCFQTFDESMLMEQGRLRPNFANCRECIEYAKQLGINVASDVITYWTKTERDWKILKNDLSNLKNLNIDEITISVLYQNKYNQEFTQAAGVYREIKRAVKEYFPTWENPENTLDDFYDVAAIRIYNPNSEIRKDFEIYINSLSDIPWEHEQGYSTLGFGTYKNGDKACYSIIGQDALIYEEFKGFKKFPKLHIHRRWSFWEAAKNVINALEEQYSFENPPAGSSLVLTNICQSLNKNPFEHHIQGNCKFELCPRQCFSGKTKKEIKQEEKFFLKSIDKNEVNKYNN